eukprot:scaffold5048_cov82-Cyclotella_meneghiniana.AAC.5
MAATQTLFSRVPHRKSREASGIGKKQVPTVYRWRGHPLMALQARLSTIITYLLLDYGTVSAIIEGVARRPRHSTTHLLPPPYTDAAAADRRPRPQTPTHASSQHSSLLHHIILSCQRPLPLSM